MDTYLTPEKVQRLIHATKNDRDRLMLSLLWSTGMRVSELIGITVNDIDFEEATVIIRHQKSGRPGKFRQIPLTSQLAIDCADYIQRYKIKGRLFPMVRQSVNVILRQAAEDAGLGGKRLVHPETNRKHYISPHKLRDALAVHWLKKKGDAEGQKGIQNMLGHSSFEMTAKYFKLGLQDLRKMQEQALKI